MLIVILYFTHKIVKISADDEKFKSWNSLIIDFCSYLAQQGVCGLVVLLEEVHQEQEDGGGAATTFYTRIVVIVATVVVLHSEDMLLPVS